jgi:hypothetical protein
VTQLVMIDFNAIQRSPVQVEPRQQRQWQREQRRPSFLQSHPAAPKHASLLQIWRATFFFFFFFSIGRSTGLLLDVQIQRLRQPFECWSSQRDAILRSPLGSAPTVLAGCIEHDEHRNTSEHSLDVVPF